MERKIQLPTIEKEELSMCKKSQIHSNRHEHMYKFQATKYIKTTSEEKFTFTQKNDLSKTTSFRKIYRCWINLNYILILYRQTEGY